MSVGCLIFLDPLHQGVSWEKEDWVPYWLEGCLPRARCPHPWPGFGRESPSSTSLQGLCHPGALEAGAHSLRHTREAPGRHRERPAGL